MHMQQESPGTSCSDCSGCSLAPPPSETERRPLEGWKFAMASAGLFWLPVVLAVVGSQLAGGSLDRQFLGGAAGLAVGMGGAIIVGRLLGRSNEESA